MPGNYFGGKTLLKYAATTKTEVTGFHIRQLKQEKLKLVGDKAAISER